MAHSNSGIYEIRNLENGKRYIGSAVNPPNRKRQHFQSLARGDHHSVSLQRAWNKYGADKFKFIQLIICSKENLITYEQDFIDGYKPEYNIAPKAGSQLGFKMSDEARKKMSESRPKNFSPMTGKSHSDATKAKISESRKGKGLGAQSEERRAKISAAHKGRVITAEQREKISATLMGHKQSQEQIAKRVEKLRGRKMPDGFAEAASARMLGRKYSEKHCENIGKASAKLSDDQVREIRTRLAKGEVHRLIASSFSVDQSVISYIKTGKSYRWVL